MAYRAELVQIDLRNLQGAELALIAKMPHIDQRVRFAAKDMLESLVSYSSDLQAEASSAVDHVFAADAALYAELVK